IQEYDNDLNIDNLKLAGIAYAGELDTNNYLISPINGDLSTLRNITILTGTYDILNPDVHILYEKAKDIGIEIEIKEYEKAQHIWIIQHNCDENLVKQGYQDLVKLVKEK
ncbi:MAG: alpha/beta hydrolase fold domain-containing protein, partial [Clostridia bacterium]